MGSTLTKPLRVRLKKPKPKARPKKPPPAPKPYPVAWPSRNWPTLYAACGMATVTTAASTSLNAAPSEPGEYVAFLLTMPPRDRDAVWVAIVMETLWDRAFAEQPQPWGVIEQIIALQMPSELWPVVVPAEVVEIIKRYVEYREWRNVLGCLVSIRSPEPVDFVLINRAYRTK